MNIKRKEIIKALKDSAIWISLFLTYLVVGLNNKHSNFLVPFFFTLIQFMTYSVNRFFFIPKFYERSKSLFYALNILTIIGFVFFMLWMGSFFIEPPENDLHKMPPDFDMFFFLFQILLCVVALWVAINQYLTEKKKIHEEEIEKLKRKNLENNLQFLKMQINPHFLFNALNNLYSMSYMGDKSTPEKINKLSDMLKYVLYDCESKFIPIHKEIEYIKNYIDFQQMKTEIPQKINFNYNLENENFLVAPMLIIPFIENAFKHSKIDRYKNHTVNININQHAKKADILIYNNYIESSSLTDNAKKYRGIGIKNVVNRLNLLYPKSHFLNISQENNQFKVELTIENNGSKQ